MLNSRPKSLLDSGAYALLMSDTTTLAFQMAVALLVTVLRGAL